MFGHDEYNALYTSFHNAANAKFDESGKLYNYIEQATRASLVCELIYELHELGYEIRKKND